MRAWTLAMVTLVALPLLAGGGRGGQHQNCPMKGKSDKAVAQRGGGGHRHGATGNGPRGMQGRGMGMGMRGDNREHHEVIHSIMGDHDKITRRVEKIDKGVRSETTSKDPAVAEQIRVHVRQMKERLESGQPIRMFDPLFREIFANHDKIDMKIEDIPGGARVTETSDDPQIALLIKKHAEAVDGFVAEGMAKMHEPTELPKGYEKK